MTKPEGGAQPKPVRWVGSSKQDVSEFPTDVRQRVGGALWEAQIGRKVRLVVPPKAGPRRGDVPPLGETGAPPCVVLADRVKLG